MGEEKIYIPKTNEPFLEAIVEAMLEYHTCGSIIATLANVETKAGNNNCARALLHCLEVREGIVYAKNEPAKKLKYHIALAQDVFTIDVKQVGGEESFGR